MSLTGGSCLPELLSPFIEVVLREGRLIGRCLLNSLSNCFSLDDSFYILVLKVLDPGVGGLRSSCGCTVAVRLGLSSLAAAVVIVIRALISVVELSAPVLLRVTPCVSSSLVDLFRVNFLLALAAPHLL